MWTAFTIGYGLLGAAVGSVLNVIIERAPQRVALLRPWPSCGKCGSRMSAGELAPVVGYLAQGGRCRACGATIPKRRLLVELSTAVLFAWLAWYRGWGLDLLTDTFYGATLLVITVIDLEHRLILNRIVFPAIWITAALAVLRLALGPPRYLHVGYWEAAGWAPALSPAARGVLSQVVGALVAFAIFLAIYLVAPQGMGDGDVRLAFLIGAMTGFPGALGAVVGAIMLGGLAAAGLLLTRRASRSTPLPFGPFMAVATWAIALWGDGWLRWYLGG